MHRIISYRPRLEFSTLATWALSITTVEFLPGLGSFTLELALCVALRYGLVAAWRFALAPAGHWWLAAHVDHAERALAEGRPLNDTIEG